jgi:hypothetical protein
MDIATLNLQPILDLLGKVGTETSEYAKAKSAGTTAKIAFWIGLLVLLAGTAASIFGADSKVGVVAGAVVAIAGVVTQVLGSNAYAAARADTKTAAASALTAVVNAAPATPAADIVPPKV